MMRNRFLSTSSVALFLAAGTTLSAQEITGSLMGRVADAKGQPMAAVRIILESPALFQPRQVVTNAKGEWRTPLLPVGVYSIKASKDGFIGQTANQIRVGVGTSPRVDFALKALVAATALVEVVDTTASADKAESKVAVNFTGEKLRTLPVPTGALSDVFSQALALSPGFIDNAGIRGSGSGGVGYVVDGIDVKDSATNTSLIKPLADGVEDVQVVVSAVNARDGRVSGGIVKAVTKTGSNTFEGTLRANYYRKAWQAEQSHSASIDAANATPDNISRSFEVTLSGPIIKDRLWFYLGTRMQPETSGNTTLMTPWWPDKPAPLMAYNNPTFPSAFANTLPKLNDVLRTGPGNGYAVDLMEAGAAIPTKTKTDKMEMKFTGSLTPDHVVTLSFFTDNNENTNYADSVASMFRANREFYGPTTFERQAYTLSWNGALASNLLLEASHTQNQYEKTEYPGPQDKPVSVWSGVGNGGATSQYTWGPVPIGRVSASEQPERHVTRATKANLKYFVDFRGSHDIDFGFESVYNGYDSGRPSGAAADRVLVGGHYRNVSGDFLFPTVQFTGPNAAGQSSGPSLFPMMTLALVKMGPAPVYVQSYAASGEAATKTTSLYVNDTWSFNDQWGLNLGLRWNHYRIHDTDGTRLLGNTALEPRFQLKWNPDGAGRNVVRLTAAQYAQEYTTSFARSFATDPLSVFVVSGWKGLSGQPLPGDPNDPMGLYGARFVTYDQLINKANYGAAFQYQDTRQLRALMGVKVPYAQEISLSFQHSGKAGSVGLSLSQRQYKDNMVQVQDYGFDAFTLVKDPSGTGGAPKWQQRRTYTNNPYYNTYRTAEFSWQQPLSSRLSWGGSITYHIETGPSTTSVTSYPSLRFNPIYGLRPEDTFQSGTLSRGQKIRAFWNYAHPIGKGGALTCGLLADYIEGAANGSYLQSLTATMRYAPLTPMVDPNGYAVEQVTPTYSRIYSPMGAYKMAKDSYNLSAKVDWKLPLGWKKLQLIGGISVSRLLNDPAFIATPYLGDSMGYLSSGAVAGRLMRTFSYQPGSFPNLNTRNEKGYYTSARTVSELSAGLRF